MKTKIQKLNQYLLERYPIMWNTKILSIVGISLVVHLLFFIIGYNNHDELERYTSNRFGVGLVFFNIIVSILILLYWIISLSKNNAFKDYYPTSANKLFVHFIHYFVIIFFATTFYISHQIGITTYVRVKFSKSVLEKEIEQVNKGAIFLSHYKNKYTGYVKEDEISYYNYNDYFINPNVGSYQYFDYNSDYVVKLLASPDSKVKIIKILTDFLSVADKYDVKTNLTVQKWLNVVYSDKNTPFGVNKLIEEYESNRNYDYEEDDYENDIEDEVGDGCIEPSNNYKRQEVLYLDSYRLKNSINSKKDLFRHHIPNSLEFFVWFCLFITVIIFVIRVTSLRLFLLSLVSVALLSVFVSLFVLMSKSSRGGVENFIVVIFVSLLLIVVPYFLLNKKSDSLSGILISISLPAFPVFLLSLVIYSNERLLKDQFHLVSEVMFVMTIAYIYTRCYMFKKWKGLPEG